MMPQSIRLNKRFYYFF